MLANEPVSPGNDFVTLCGNMGNRSIFLPDGVDEALDIFKLIVSTERVDSFLLEQEDLKLGEILSKPVFSGLRDVDTTVTYDWFTKIIMVKTVRQKAQITRDEVSPGEDITHHIPGMKEEKKPGIVKAI